MGIRTNILARVYLAFGLVLLLAIAVVVQLCRLQYVQGDKWKAMAADLSAQYQTVEAARGNIFSVDGSLLATSVPEYELHMDMLAGGIASDTAFNNNIDLLAAKLSGMFGDRSAREYSRVLREARRDSSRYVLIRRKVSYQDLKKIRQFPVFNMGKYKGGLIVIQKNRRILPFQSLAARTIGYKNENVKNPVGLEGAYSAYINGESGRRLMQRIPGGIWMPVDDDDEIAPKDGADIISTINVNFQDVAQDALKKQLVKSAADHGCVVLMEVSTGEIRAIANYTRTKDGDYKEQMNYAISNAIDPGSTFKLASYMTMLDQHKIDTSTIVNAEGGKYKFPKGPTITDTEHDNYEMSVKRAFEESSNVAAAKLVDRFYHNNPWEYINKLYSYHLNEKLQLQIPGEGRPVIKNPSNRSWNKNYSLPEMAYGYEMNITPLQMLAYYNSVANNGKMIAPLLVREIRRLGNPIEQFQARVINEQVCSEATLGKVRGMLEGVVLNGTGKNVIKNKLYSVAGKTGTAQVANGTKGYKDKKYQASFCGYFPADHPKYSMIVVINNPTQGDYLAAKVAGPVFREVADRVYANDLDINQTSQAHFVGNTVMPQVKQGNMKALKKVYSKLGVKPLYASANSTVDTSNGIPFEEVKYKNGTVPAVTGMGLSDALYVMGNAGYKVTVRGSGIVTNQSVTGGSAIPKGSRILIELQ
ncbi:transpeptidase family protein [Mucilaginibacter rubeus]|uniref:Transpeptidase family protein n=1 Tax=Mucilaginibacter rubeus TaxID=2027860 RepID=A0AAE6JHV7_9SPHI|nr:MULTISPECIES: penicillin-binding protein [Mucilaginibacter]QEM05761.1 transpeptidase family protein [Mucilaginibacter rubeus]QEM18348.1 transpeptidase family protein [Mucilaginibacter gossypii]QTE45117.1 transpeptidase family protein [Mucilaginibacter rubeus]QTE51714.1 transpeptidase family protein [Mucilaginibacter rubeus]QTE56800.1 transpeptidase family protein [Mucilaginibacter rubeus]